MRVHLLFRVCAYMWRPGGSLGWMSFLMCHSSVLRHDHSLGWNLPSRIRLADSDLSVPIYPALELHVCATMAIFTHTGMHTQLCMHASTSQNVRTTYGSWFYPSTRWLQKWNLASSVLCLSLPAPSVLSFCVTFFLFRELVRQCLIIWTRLASHILLPPESWD